MGTSAQPHGAPTAVGVGAQKTRALTTESRESTCPSAAKSLPSSLLWEQKMLHFFIFNPLLLWIGWWGKGESQHPRLEGSHSIKKEAGDGWGEQEGHHGPFTSGRL